MQPQNRRKNKKPLVGHRHSAFRGEINHELRTPLVARSRHQLATRLADRRIPIVQRQAIAQQIGRTYGNEVLQRVVDESLTMRSNVGPSGPTLRADKSTLQRGIIEDALGIHTELAYPSLSAIFDAVVATNMATATPVKIPKSWKRKVREFSISNPAAGFILMRALLGFPTYWKGGWILNIVSGALAMTLDKAVFAEDPLSLSTYVHELVHVNQYQITGRVGFLVSYFGLSAATIVKRFLLRQNLDVMKSSPHEAAGYNIEKSFVAWHDKKYKPKKADSITV